MAYCCNSLYTILSVFKGVTSIKDEKEKYKELARQFEKVAKGVFFGGYFQVNNIRRIYPIEIEFYYHEESPDGLKDPVMYHTKEHTKDESLSYYPLGSLNFHVSGMDVTFEKEEEYRASFLICKYKVHDLVTKEWKEEERSTYIYEDMLMRISIFDGINLQWISEQEPVDDWNPHIEWRKNVADYEKDESGQYKKDEKGNYIKIEFKGSKEDFKKLSDIEKKEYFTYSGKIFEKCTRQWRYRK